MLDHKTLCNKIKIIYPEIGECGIDVDVKYDENKKAWIVDLKKDQHHLTTHLDPQDADACILGKECTHLGIQVSQLVNNIKKS
ncbi:MAG: hypothetical protein ABIJ37_04745 [Pseudomonadota bacterium]